MTDATVREQRLGETGSHQVFARGAAVAEHHQDGSNPDKPLWLMIPGGIAAFFALLGTMRQGYQMWVATPKVPADQAMPTLLVLLVVYFVSLFGFSYGYELYDFTRALRLTVIIGIIGLAAVFILLALGAALKGLESSDSKSSSKSSSSGSSSGSSGAMSWLSNLNSSASSYSSSGGVPRIALKLNRAFGNGVVGPAVRLPLTPPGTCSFCTRPLPPPGTPKPDGSADSTRFCPKCGQAFEAAGDNARRRRPAIPAGSQHRECARRTSRRSPRQCARHWRRLMPGLRSLWFVERRRALFHVRAGREGNRRRAVTLNQQKAISPALMNPAAEG